MVSALCAVSGAALSAITRHIFGGPFRKKSDKLGLVVDLCHECHNEPPHGVHHCRETAEILKRYGQRKAMREQGWTTEQFIKEFGRNHL